MREFVALLTGSEDHHPLDLAALQLASVEHPELDPEPWIAELDRLSEGLLKRAPPSLRGADFVHAAISYFAEDLRFSGNADSYYSPANSCLNQVLTSRRGIPISLSLVYIETARRIGRTFEGIGLPGHFLLRFRDAGADVFIDTFNEGRLLFKPECFDLAKRVTGVDYSANHELLEPIAKRDFLLRMLNNLRAAYLHANNHRKALETLDLLLTAIPEAASEYKNRALCHLELRNVRAARCDFQTYLDLEPDALDRERIAELIGRLTLYLSKLN